MLSWQARRMPCCERPGGVPAVPRIDNVRTAIAKGAGAWGGLNETCRRFAVQPEFHVERLSAAPAPGKGKVERHVRDPRGTPARAARLDDGRRSASGPLLGGLEHALAGSASSRVR
jgi:hypothetical protein